MGKQNKKKSTANHKKEDGKFHSKHIDHNPQAESARAVFGSENTATDEQRDSRP